MTDRPGIISHRGLCRATAKSPRAGENTSAAFAAGIEALEALGFRPAIEFDVRRTRDGCLVVIHDPTVNRTTPARGRVSRRTAAELVRLGIPLLTDIFDRFAEAELHVEVKQPGVAAGVERLVFERRLEDRVIVSSFRWRELMALRPPLRFALTGALPGRRMIRTAVEMGAWAIHPDHRRTTRQLVETAHAHGLRVHAWTVNTPAAYDRMRKLGVDAVFSDNPRLLGV